MAVVCARAVDAQHHGRSAPDKERAVVLESWRQVGRTIEEELHVLGSDCVTRGNSLVHTSHQYHAAVEQRRPRDLGTGEIPELARELGIDAIEMRGIGGGRPPPPARATLSLSPP